MKKLIIGLVVVIFLGVIVYLIDWNQSPPVKLSLDDPDASYSIKAYSSEDSSVTYFVVYSRSSNNATAHAEVLVGNSDVDLAPYVGKNVKIHGVHAGRKTNTQCIVNKCHVIALTYPIDIAGIDLVANE